MKKTIQNLLLVGFLVLCFSQIKAQESSKKKLIKKEFINIMSNDLNLSEDQKREVENIYFKYEPEEERISNQLHLLIEERSSLKDHKATEIKRLLNAEQLVKFEEIKKHKNFK